MKAITKFAEAIAAILLALAVLIAVRKAIVILDGVGHLYER